MCNQYNKCIPFDSYKTNVRGLIYNTKQSSYTKNGGAAVRLGDRMCLVLGKNQIGIDQNWSNVRQELFARFWISDVKFTLRILMTLRNVFVNSR